MSIRGKKVDAGLHPATRAEEKEFRILVVRPDRLGDVILSTPVFEVIKRHYPKAHLAVMVREPVAQLVRGNPFVDEVILYDPERRHWGFRGFLRLVGDLRARRFRVAVVLQSHRRIAAAIFLANIRYRVGPLSKLHSYFFYNRGARQRRSHVEMHETDYNLQLLRRLGIRVGTRRIPLQVSYSQSVGEKARAWLIERGFVPGETLVAVHPGMGGSALNWPESHYVEFIHALLRDGRRVLVTGGPSEVSLLNRIREALGSQRDKAIFYGSADPQVAPLGSVEFLAGLFSCCNLVVAPSTGPLHLAVALGKPVVTFYPPIRVQSAIRWGPYLADESQASILVPEVYCGQEFKCLGNLCNYFPCMKGLTVIEALEEADRQLARVDRFKT